MSNNTQASGGGIGFFGVLFFLLLVLKLTDQIDWSWWWVTSPLWGPAALGLVIGILYYSWRKIFWNKKR